MMAHRREVLDKGGACDHFVKTAGKGLVGHNNEKLVKRTVKQCEEACCLRPWCLSFDYVRELDPPPSLSHLPCLWL
jgi:hypothetical protein